PTAAGRDQRRRLCPIRLCRLAPVERPTMTIHVKLFAILRDRAGLPELDLEVPPGATVAAAGAALGEQVPAIRDHLAHSGFAVNRTYAGPGQALADGDELAAIPPVSGG